MTNNILFAELLDLQLFAEGTGTGDGSATGVSATDAVSQDSGVTAPAAEEQTTDVVDLDAEFDELINTKYKEQYRKRSSADTQEVVRKRLAGTKETVDNYEALSPTLELLYEKYGIKKGDVKALNAAITEDDSYYEQEAMEKGVTVEHLKELKKLRRENTELKAIEDKRASEESIAKQYTAWMDQAEKARVVYPSLDLNAEAKNPQFVSLLKAGIDVRTAFEVVHRDEIISGAMQYAAKAAETKVVNRVKANGARPPENGTKSSSAATVKSDVSKLTATELAEFNRRIARGEKISFG